MNSFFQDAKEEGGRRQGGNLNDDLILHFGYLGNFLVIIISALYSPSIGDRVTRIKVNMWCQTISLGGSTQASLSFTCPGYFTSFFCVLTLLASICMNISLIIIFWQQTCRTRLSENKLHKQIQFTTNNRGIEGWSFTPSHYLSLP